MNSLVQRKDKRGLKQDPKSHYNTVKIGGKRNLEETLKLIVHKLREIKEGQQELKKDISGIKILYLTVSPFILNTMRNV
ncbi:hypothetical protein WQ57_14780 [Mesobacillus campisalis]|uniref:Uncharacterized protein n=1 Tax=Mesobacillus campisalis TaxID=1408103 RepID=A0A0M2SRK8_9BACI|nr:hypothetical protein WQ57_14780 [Mesobacillus campisalis]